MDFIPLFKDFDIKPVSTTVENPLENGPIQRVHKVIHNMIVNKYIKTRAFYYINTWGDILTSVAWSTRELLHSTFDAYPDQLFFGIYMIFNLTPFIEWCVIQNRKPETGISKKSMRK